MIARVPRSEVTSTEFHRGLTTGLVAIRFRNGDMWQVEVAKVHHRAARKVVAQLDTHTAAS